MVPEVATPEGIRISAHRTDAGVTLRVDVPPGLHVYGHKEQTGLPLAVFVNGEPLPCPTKAPTQGENTEEVMARVLGKSEAEIARLRESGVFG